LEVGVYAGALWERDPDIALKQMRQRYTEVSFLTYSSTLFEGLKISDTPAIIREKLYEKVDILSRDSFCGKFVEENKPRLLSDIDIVVGLMELMLFSGGQWMIDTADSGKFSEGLLKFSRLVQDSTIE